MYYFSRAFINIIPTVRKLSIIIFTGHFPIYGRRDTDLLSDPVFHSLPPVSFLLTYCEKTELADLILHNARIKLFNNAAFSPNCAIL
jgi:hypothetical protein